MAKPSIEIISILRATATHLENSELYEWGHMGACNCGFLAQQVTGLKKADIHDRAMQGYGDWNEQLNDYCPTSGLALDDVITNLLSVGFDIDDLKRLERLSDEKVLHQMKVESLERNQKRNVVAYIRAWANLLEEELLSNVSLSLANVNEFELAAR